MHPTLSIERFPKKVLFSNFSEEVIEKRKEELNSKINSFSTLEFIV